METCSGLHLGLTLHIQHPLGVTAQNYLLLGEPCVRVKKKHKNEKDGQEHNVEAQVVILPQKGLSLVDEVLEDEVAEHEVRGGQLEKTQAEANDDLSEFRLFKSGQH